MNTPVVAITGAARRIGRATAKHFHSRGHNVVVHYNASSDAAVALVADLNYLRPNSAQYIQGDLGDAASIAGLGQAMIDCFSRLDVLVNNASVYYPTPLVRLSAQQWQHCHDINVTAPLLLSQQLAAELSTRRGAIVNIIDACVLRPEPDHIAYGVSKGALATLTRGLAAELAPSHIRVNGVAPGAISWPEGSAALSADAKKSLLTSIPMGRLGSDHDIASAVYHLACEAFYVTGHTLKVDGGRSLQQH